MSSRRLSEIDNDLRALFDLAKKVKEESVFQEEPLYKKFKAKYNGRRIDVIHTLMFHFWKMKFYHECIYWSYKFLSDRVSEKKEKVRIYGGLMRSYFELQNYEKANEYGYKWFELEKQMSGSFDTQEKITILEMMGSICNKFQKFEDLEKYERELLKAKIDQYNKGKVDLKELLTRYLTYVTSQVQNGNFKTAYKTFKNIKLFHLNSMSAKDVKQAVDNDQCIKKCPILFSSWHEMMGSTDGNPFRIPKNMKDLDKAVNDTLISKMNGNNEIFEESSCAATLLFQISKLCKIKSELLMKHEKDNFEEWSQLSFLLLYNSQMYVRMTLRHSSGDGSGSRFIENTSYLISVMLKLSYEEPHKRKKLFSLLYLYLQGNRGRYFANKVQKCHRR